MADEGLRIIELDAILTVKDNDVLPIVDSSISDPNSDTKKVSIQQIKSNINAYTKLEINNLLSGKASTSDLPTKTSDLVNDDGFVTQDEIDIHNASHVAHQDIRNLISNIEVGIGDIDDYISSDSNNQIIKGSDDRLYVSALNIGNLVSSKSNNQLVVAVEDSKLYVSRSESSDAIDYFLLDNGIFNTTIGATNEIDINDVVAIIPGSILKVKDIVSDIHGTQTKVQSIDDTTVITITFMRQVQTDWGSIGGNLSNQTDLQNVLNSKLNRNFLNGSKLVQDVILTEKTNGFSIKKILADPNNPATMNWVEHDTLIHSSSGTIQIKVSGNDDNRTIDLNIPVIDGGIIVE